MLLVGIDAQGVSFTSLSFPVHKVKVCVDAGVAAGYKLPEMPEPSGDSYQKAVEVLLPYLLSHRSRLATLSSKVEP